ncbi:MAG TPA: exodeoxyribonuclease VII small subunit [Thermoclostridium sp.]|nr:exodeoxyribonuclease VII small subunit [Thermoclostridium sp.]HPU44804.1 exodeoxyribonuclease VII small subunit [Thermoclostridium sp.]
MTGMQDSQENRNLTYEEAAGELEKAIAVLEKGDLPLEESIQVFEKAIGLVRLCNMKLDEIEKKITILVEGKDGVRETDFEPDAG